jgi:hypothetical protein
MDAQAALELAKQVVEAIGAKEEERARTIFNAQYPGFRPEMRQGKPLHWMASFFYELDEFLNDSEARRRANLTPGLILSSYQDLQRDAEDQASVS